eukprot:4330252-Prymnesium_polylepis.2
MRPPQEEGLERGPAPFRLRHHGLLQVNAARQGSGACESGGGHCGAANTSSARCELRIAGSCRRRPANHCALAASRRVLRTSRSIAALRTPRAVRHSAECEPSGRLGTPRVRFWGERAWRDP